jgi:alpha-glucoside transport system permease protein
VPVVIKAINALLTVVAGVGVALALFWLLNKLTELLPERWEDRIKPYVYILPAFAAISLYLLYPALQTILYSFANSDSTKLVGFRNYSGLLKSHGFQQTLFNTLIWIAVAPIAAVILGLAVAVLVDRLKAGPEKLSKTVIFLPMAISAVGAATVWKFIYASNPPGQSQIGLQNAIITKFGADPVPWLEKSTFHVNTFMLIIMFLWSQVGFSMVLLSAAIKSVPDEIVEAARIDGATELQVFRRIIVPTILPTIVVVLTYMIINAMKVFDIVFVMGNAEGRGTEVIAERMIAWFFVRGDFGKGAAIAVVLFVAIIPVMIYNIRRFREQETIR